MKKSDLIAGKHWVQDKNNRIGCVIEKGIVFKDFSVYFNHYDEDLTCIGFAKNDNNTITKVLISKDGCCGVFDCESDFEVIAEINSLKQITTLEELEKVREKLSKDYPYNNLYSTNISGKWEIKIENIRWNMYGVVNDVIENQHKTLDLEDEGYEINIKEV